MFENLQKNLEISKDTKTVHEIRKIESVNCCLYTSIEQIWFTQMHITFR